MIVAVRKDSAEENVKVTKHKCFSRVGGMTSLHHLGIAELLIIFDKVSQHIPNSHASELIKGPFISGSYGRSRSASPGSGSRIRKYSPRRWFSRKSLDPVQIKVYEVDDIERVRKAMDPNSQVKKLSPFVSFPVFL